MNSAPPMRLRMAMREAGRAYVYAAIAAPELPFGIGLIDDGAESRGRSMRLAMAETETAEVVFARQRFEAALRWSLATEVAITLAGPLAEARHRERTAAAGMASLGSTLDELLDPCRPATDADSLHVRRMLRELAPRRPLPACREILFRTSLILEASWPRVRRLGRRLLDVGILDARAVAEHFRRWPADTRHLDV